VTEKSPDDEINKLEDTVKDILGDISEKDSSGEEKTDQKLSSLETLVKGALTELMDLEGNLLNIIQPSPGGGQDFQENNLLMAVRRFQNAMKVALFDGASKRDMSLFEEAFNFYNNAVELVSTTGNQDDIDQIKSEFAQDLHKISELGEQIKDNDFNPFMIKTFKGLAEIYDSFEQYKTGLAFHGRAGNLLNKDPNLIIQANFEYFEAILGYLLINEMERAKKLSNYLKVKHIKIIADDLIPSFNEKNADGFKRYKNKIEALGAQRRIDVKGVIFLLNNVREKIIGPSIPTAVETLEVPSEVVPLSSERMNAIKASLTKGIQHLQAAHPNIQVPITAQIDTASIVSELKEVISSEISKEIKSLSDDIVSKILGSIPTGSISSPRPRSAGFISDEGVPDIEVVDGGASPGERPRRPKLDEMLDSVIVSE